MIVTTKNPLLLLFGLFSILIFTVSFSACDTIIGTIDSMNEFEEVDPKRTNTNDPASPNFELPGIKLTNAGFDPSVPIVVESNTYQFSWEVVDTLGNPINYNEYSFSFAYAPPGEIITDLDFQDLLDSKSILVEGLDETFNGETYTFELRAVSNQEEIPDEQRNKSISGTFVVNAMQSRGFVFRPQEIREGNDGYYTAQIFIDEILLEDDLTALSLVIDYNSNQVLVEEQNITIYDDERSFLYRDGGEIISFAKVEDNQIIIDAGVAGNNLAAVSGGGAFCEIKFTSRFNFSSSTLSISSSSIFKTSEGSDIEVLELDDAVIIQ